MDMQSVSSSNIAAVGYDEAEKKLHVQFHNGSTYAYEGVPADVHSELVGAESVGKYFNAHVKDSYPYARV